MSKAQTNIKPLLLGSDYNAYGMARSFHELLGRPVKIFASTLLAPCRYSKIVEPEICEGFDKDPIWFEHMKKIKQRYKDHKEPVLLISCSDVYSELIVKHLEELSDVFICLPNIKQDMFAKLVNKTSFYEICEKYDLPYPKTAFISKKDAQDLSSIRQDFEYPVILKPADSVSWLKVDFPGRKKAFKIRSRKEFEYVIEQSYKNGYEDTLILQDFIPGDDSSMRVLNAYCSKEAKVKFMSLGHPILEDPSPACIGNYTAILPDYSEEICIKIRGFLEKINYVGFANFDMKYDIRDGQYKLFEFNPRQGRSSFFVSAGGENLAKWLIDDYALDCLKDKDLYIANKDENKHELWLSIATSTFKKYAAKNEATDKALALIKEGKYISTFKYEPDYSFMRLILHKYINYLDKKQFKLYFKENKG
ncbi:MAG: carboxylate--amine ligase [Enterococcus sp.]|nr:carboxylate--amine ligase [Enterococcus sp.]